ncbi:hypothetical protein Pst134EA_019359 [Puccinia striiformis f. sp. tritici]|uniref:hypothetical protein n=1 Tax=Puccinia striiformis f. sp. tritici TaxID=168172 RepID=UPI00200796E6|nr:hypothetical protein Pst134EA_019359 [Puccinia striiformis f. sp. tritici]KAH9459210.1 hypothetical protein Pst134EA_019359 [Puccinia striiformis f. sp. tritici]
MVVVMKNRISASSPPEQQPKTWQEYNTLYANEQIDVINPPLPPMESNEDGEAVTELPFEYYVAPQPPNEAVRQLVLNRLGLLGGKPFDPTQEGVAKTIARLEIGDKLISEGKGLQAWSNTGRHGSIANDGSSSNIEETRAMIGDVRSGRLPPETLEQHPIFRNIVKRSRELFNSTLGILSILDEDRQVFLAESGMNEAGMGGLREAARDMTMCAHTILSGQQKIERLSATQAVWDVELKRVSRPPSENEESLESEVLGDTPTTPLRSATSSNLSSGFKKWKSSSSLSTAPPMSPSCSSAGPQSPTKSSPSLFEDHNAADLGRTMIISGHNIPLPVPELDAGLHLRVLRAGEGGLLYQNPSMEECQEAALQPKIASNGHADPYTSAILLAVGAEINPNVGGFVLAGYTNDHRRVFGEEDVSFMKQFANQLSTYTSRVPLS